MKSVKLYKIIWLSEYIRLCEIKKLYELTKLC